MNTHKRTIPYLVILGLVVAGCLLISPDALPGETPSGSSEEIRQLLSQVKTEAVALDHDSEQLAAWARSKQAHWNTHAERLNLIREHINKAGQLLTQLNEARATASPWQHQAIDRIYPLLKELADNTEATINLLNDNRGSIHFSAYSDYAKAGAELANELAALVKDYVEFGEHEAEFHRLQDKLAGSPS
jgi:chromosome segregation ATPase